MDLIVSGGRLLSIASFHHHKLSVLRHTHLLRCQLRLLIDIFVLIRHASQWRELFKKLLQVRCLIHDGVPLGWLASLVPGSSLSSTSANIGLVVVAGSVRLRRGRSICFWSNQWRGVGRGEMSADARGVVWVGWWCGDARILLVANIDGYSGVNRCHIWRSCFLVLESEVHFCGMSAR